MFSKKYPQIKLLKLLMGLEIDNKVHRGFCSDVLNHDAFTALCS